VESQKTLAQPEAYSAHGKLINVSDMPVVGNVIPMNPAPAKQGLNSYINSFAKGEEDDVAELGSLFKDMLYNIHEWKLKKLPHVKEYKKLRKLHSEIMTSMAHYLDEGNFEHKIDTAAGISASEAMQKQRKSKEPVTIRLTSINFDMNTYEGEQAYYDMHFYKMALNANSITEEYIQSRRYRKPEKIAMLESMNNSVRGLFEITEIDSDQGYIHLKEVFTNQVFKIIDIGMSMQNTNTEMYIYRRIITVGEISMGAGVTLTFKKTDKFIKDFIKCERADYHPVGEMVRFNELYNHYTTAPNRIELEHHEVK
jgi:hypothetical protein